MPVAKPLGLMLWIPAALTVAALTASPNRLPRGRGPRIVSPVGSGGTPRRSRPIIDGRGSDRRRLDRHVGCHRAIHAGNRDDCHGSKQELLQDQPPRSASGALQILIVPAHLARKVLNQLFIAFPRSAAPRTHTRQFSVIAQCAGGRSYVNDEAGAPTDSTSLPIAIIRSSAYPAGSSADKTRTVADARKGARCPTGAANLDQRVTRPKTYRTAGARP